MIITIIICVTALLLAVIGSLYYYLHLKAVEEKRLDNMCYDEPKDNRIYLDRLRMLRSRYEQVHLEVLDDFDLPEDIRYLLYLVGDVTSRLS